VPLHDNKDEIWCAVTGTVIGTSFYLSIINSETYTGQTVTPFAENVSDEVKQQRFSQQDSASSHTTNNSTATLYTEVVLIVMATVMLCNSPTSSLVSIYMQGSTCLHESAIYLKCICV
jgi:hypothetical protein